MDDDDEYREFQVLKKLPLQRSTGEIDLVYVDLAEHVAAELIAYARGMRCVLYKLATSEDYMIPPDIKTIIKKRVGKARDALKRYPQSGLVARRANDILELDRQIRAYATPQ